MRQQMQDRKGNKKYCEDCGRRLFSTKSRQVGKCAFCDGPVSKPRHMTGLPRGRPSRIEKWGKK